MQTFFSRSLVLLFAVGLFVPALSSCNRCSTCECVGDQVLELCRQDFASKDDWELAKAAAELDDACECSD